jgi:hypothetical protein
MECRRRKIKCDREDPCTQCTQSKSASCTYKDGFPGSTYGQTVAAKKNSSVTPSVLPESSDHLNSYGFGPLLDSDLSVVANNGRFQGSNSRTVPLFNGSHSSSTTLYSPSAGSPEEPQTEHHVQILSDRVSKLEQNLKTVTPGNLDPMWTSFSTDGNKSFFGQADKVPVPELRGSISKTRLFGQSHWMSSFEHVSNALVTLQYSVP